MPGGDPGGAAQAGMLGRPAAPAPAVRLLEHVPSLNARSIVLASASPRRKELLERVGLKFRVVVSAFDETLPKAGRTAAEYALETARRKAEDVAAALAAQGGAADLVIGADTVVEARGEVLEKPVDADDARRMLRLLSACGVHHVHTGVALVTPARVRCFAVTTAVEFEALSEGTIEAYVASGEPDGKAGAYAIQGAAGAFVRRVDGCFQSVVGFPLSRFCVEVAALVDEGALL